MKRIRESTAVKIIISVLVVICNALFVIGILITSYIKDQEVYEKDKEVLLDERLEDMVYQKLDGQVIEYLEHELNVEQEDSDEKSSEEYAAMFLPENSNFFFKAKDKTGRVVLKSYTEEDYRLEISTVYNRTYKKYAEKIIVFNSNHERMIFNPYRTYEDNFIVSDCDVVLNSEGLWQAEIKGYYKRQERITVYGYLRTDFTAKDEFYDQEVFVNKLYGLKNIVPCATLAVLMLSIILVINLIRFARHRKGKEGVYLSLIDRIPLDILAAALIAIPFIAVKIINNLDSRDYKIICGVCAIVYLSYAALFIVTFAARIKKGVWWKNTVLFKLFRFIIKAGIPGVIRFIKKTITFISPCIRRLAYIIICLFRKLPIYWKAGLAYILLAAAELICIILTFGEPDMFILIWSIEKLLLAPAIILIVLNMRTLQKGGEQLALGKLEHKVNLRYMFWDFKKHGENLNSINIGMQNAVEEQMKSERFKTELITNVSHDIKTPLTSIVTYVDLLKREDVQPEAAKQYVEVLDRQSAKLKKLIDDLMEASKASTGNIKVNLEELDVNILLTQTLGEYVEKLDSNKNTLITNYCSESVMVNADGQLLWRVFDNLMSNICKYTQEGTRVYINIESLGDEVKIIFKNISKFELNISADELMERFVRGDSSRNTDGNGLGLSIAKNLMQLQDGKLDILIDGDLFKAEVTLKTLTD